MRPFVVCAVLRGVAFDAQRYNSFIDLQVARCCRALGGGGGAGGARRGVGARALPPFEREGGKPAGWGCGLACL